VRLTRELVEAGSATLRFACFPDVDVNGRDLKGRAQKYLNVFPPRKAVQRGREKLREKTKGRQRFRPIPVLMGELLFLCGPKSSYYEIDRYVQDRLIRHLQRHSQRPCLR